MIKFNENGIIKAKDYLIDYIIRGEKYCLIIIITHNKYTFFTNN